MSTRLVRPLSRPLVHPQLLRATCLAFLVACFMALLVGVPAPSSAQTSPSTPSAEPAAASAAGPTTGSFTEVMDVRVVNVDVYVTDRSGKRVEDLSRDDFELKVDGKEMPISNFYSQAGGRARETVREIERRTDSTFTPIEQVQEATQRRNHVVILIDHSRLRPANRARAFTALRQTISGLGAEDLVAVVGVEGSLVFYSDFLYDRKAISEILDEVQNVAVDMPLSEIDRRLIFGELARGQSGGYLARVSDVSGPQTLARIQAYAAQEFARSERSLEQIDAVVATLAGVAGRKALLYLGEGIPQRPGEGMWVEWRNRFAAPDGGSELGLRHYDFNTDYEHTIGRYDLTDRMQRTANIANRAGVTFYAIDAEGDHGGELRSALTEQGSTSESVSVVDENFRAPLEFTTQATGGKLLRSSGSLVEQLDGLLGDFETFYSLGFRQPDEWEPGSNHDIEVKVKRRRTSERYRESVRVPMPGEMEASATVTALMFETVDNPLDITATPGSEAPREDGNAALPVLLKIPVGRLALVPQNETFAVSLTIFVSIKDKNGNPGPVQKIPFHLDIPKDVIDQAKNDSAHYTLPLVLRPGDRQVAIGVRDDLSGTLSTIRVDVAQFTQALGGS